MKHDKFKEKQMKTLTVAFIGHRQVKNWKELIKKVRIVVSKLIDEENAETFLFGSNSSFDSACVIAVKQIKEYFYPLIKRIYVRASYEKITEEYRSYLLTDYDETFYPYGVKNAGYRCYVKRNQIMIDMCDILVTYYDMDYQQMKGCLSGTKNAVEYALKKNKRIINLYDM